MTKYPTPEEIMKIKMVYKKETIECLKNYKKKIKKSKEFKDIKDLIINLSKIYEKEVTVIYSPDTPTCFYNIKEKLIVMNKSLSTISALHEFAHHLYGKSELTACRWSLQLFEIVFKKQFDKLEWEGHMKVRKK